MAETRRTTYCKWLTDGRYEYGAVFQERGKRDKIIPHGIAATYTEACAKAGMIPATAPLPPMHSERKV